MLGELGVEALSYEIPARAQSSASAQIPNAPAVKINSPVVPAAPPPAMPSLKKDPEPPSPRTAGSRLKELPSLSSRKVAPQSAKPVGKTPSATTTPAPAFEPAVSGAGDTIQGIRAEIGECLRCPLAAERIQVVHSTGNLDADLMFVGEAPGADEDEQGLPFVGRAGKLLTDIIAAMGFSRQQVFIGNINRCRPPGNRQPVPIETEACRPFLLREIAIVRPKVIVVLGNTATQNLLQIKTPISKLRGNFQDYFGVKVMPTFHPAYLLRDPHKKRDVWEDMKKVRDFLAGA